jgi:mono/diheme cytochrome c family protein
MGNSYKGKIPVFCSLIVLAAILLSFGNTPATASSHREALSASLGPGADISDFCMFKSYESGKSDKLVLAMNVIPVQEPAGGPIFYNFPDNVRYRFNIDTNRDGVANDIIYEVKFTTEQRGPATSTPLAFAGFSSFSRGISAASAAATAAGTTTGATGTAAATGFTGTTTATSGTTGFTATTTATSASPNGRLLYAGNCARCHGSLAVSEEKGAPASSIQSAINNNRGGMGMLRNMSAAQVAAVASALSATSTSGTTGTTGTTGFSNATGAAATSTSGTTGFSNATSAAARTSGAAATTGTPFVNNTSTVGQTFSGISSIPPAITALNGRGSEGLGIRQTYTVTKIENGTSTNVGSGTMFAVPSNVGPRTMPNYEQLAQQGIYTLSNGGRVFAGQRDDPFYADLGAIFDSFNFRNGTAVLTDAEDASSSANAAGAVDTLSGFNVNTIAIEVPISDVTSDTSGEIGAYASTIMTTTFQNGSTESSQVNRLGNPLVNELLINENQKDAWSKASPQNDSAFLGSFTSPGLAKLLNAFFRLNIPESGRSDLVDVFLKYKNQTGGTLSDLLRLDLTAPATSADQQKRLGLFNLTSANTDLAAWPNGRRPNDDVVDTFLRIVAGSRIKANTPLIGDGVNFNIGATGTNTTANGISVVFPLMPTPHDGRGRTHVDPGDAAPAAITPVFTTPATTGAATTGTTTTGTTGTAAPAAAAAATFANTTTGATTATGTTATTAPTTVGSVPATPAATTTIGTTSTTTRTTGITTGTSTTGPSTTATTGATLGSNVGGTTTGTTAATPAPGSLGTFPQ